MAAKKYFWIRKKGNFGKNIRFGDPMPSLDSDMEKHLKRLGYIDDKKPVSFDASQASAFESMKQENSILAAESEQFRKKNMNLVSENKELSEENVDLKNQVSKFNQVDLINQELSGKVTELTAELDDFPKNVKEANKKIKSLEKELAELTKPGKK